MLDFDLPDHAAGMVLIGDTHSLSSMHRILHDVNERSPLIHNKEGPFLGLAYDVRKAKDGMRETLDDGVFGVKILWPVLLLQARMLRASLAWIDHTKWHQAVAYSLEAVIEQALQAQFSDSARLIELWERLDPADPRYFDRLDSRAALFCSWSKATRHKRFTGLLLSFDSMYERAYAGWSKTDDTMPTPEELKEAEASEAWQEFNW